MFSAPDYPQGPPSRHMYLEPTQAPDGRDASAGYGVPGVYGPPGYHHPSQRALPPPPLALAHAQGLHHQRHQPFCGETLGHSPTATCYSPGGSLGSDGAMSDYVAEGLGSRSPSLASPEAASPPPGRADAAVAPGIGAERKPRRRGAQYSAEEKERRRKVSHSAIEKRRRERTNDVLGRLQRMVPGLGKGSKVQKLEILQASAIYISKLHRLLGLSDDGTELPAPAAPAVPDATRAHSQMKVGFLLS
ncbi:hypothetical protein H4R18_002662 [Coemansia javaensis]|uniref:BHLH domain-containing protein n=1 Tax=Coemansia javaensis TaxID=2761396 RepID=A0A9W8HA72_9FUNG|nr:hypothetical protein H4R18_002662 [Coemansia javaensis]